MNFLELPREIRDLILGIVLHESDAPNPTVLHVKKWNTKTDVTDPTATKVLCSSIPAEEHALSRLSQVNWQLREEANAAIAHQQKASPRDATLKLDLLLDALTTYYATWCRVLPFTGPKVETVYMQIRPFFALQYTRDLLLPSTIQTGSPDPPIAALWRLGAVINGLLSRGPTRMGRHGAGAKAKPFTIERLVVEVLRPDVDVNLPDENDVECARIAAQHAEDFEAHMLANAENNLSDRIGGTSHVPWGMLMLQRVRKLVIVNNGKVLREVDVVATARLFHVPLFEPAHSMDTSA